MTPAGWLLVDDELPRADSTKLISEPGKSFVWYRTDAIIGFKDEITDPQKQAFFAETGIIVLGVTSDGSFYVRIPDPGPTWAAFDAYHDGLAGRPEIETVVPLSRTAIRPRPNGRWPTDGQGNHRTDWPLPFDALRYE